MAWSVVPLRAIAFQFLFLLIAIAIEAIVFYNQLRISRKTSVEYAASINLLSTFIGWLIFFNVQPLIPLAYKSELISYILFNQWSQTGTLTWLILIAFVTFFITFGVKVAGLDLLQLLLQINTKDDLLSSGRAYKYRDRLRRQEASGVTRRRAAAVLLANACSYSAISLILLGRSFLQNNPIFK
jgi:hypothetical protein